MVYTINEVRQLLAVQLRVFTREVLLLTDYSNFFRFRNPATLPPFGRPHNRGFADAGATLHIVA